MILEHIGLFKLKDHTERKPVPLPPRPSPKGMGETWGEEVKIRHVGKKIKYIQMHNHHIPSFGVSFIFHCIGPDTSYGKCRTRGTG